MKAGTSNPTVLPRHRREPGFKPIRDASMFREPTPLSAFATTREDGLPAGEQRTPPNPP